MPIVDHPESALSSCEGKELVLNTPWLDSFCSGPEWTLSFHRAFAPERKLLVEATSDSWLCFAKGIHPAGFEYVEPLESMWGLSCPILGLEEQTSVNALVEFICRQDTPEVIIISGVLSGTKFHRLLQRQVWDVFQTTTIATTTRHVASLEGGASSFLSRRSTNFQKSLSKVERKVDKLGIEIEEFSVEQLKDARLVIDLYHRILAIDKQSWKGLQGVGIVGPMETFYRSMLPQLAQRGTLRLLLAKYKGIDIAYIVGGISKGVYRGLQFSFVNEYRHLGLGNFCQWKQIESLCREGIEAYDLGTEMDYKKRWAESVVESDVCLIVARN